MHIIIFTLIVSLISTRGIYDPRPPGKNIIELTTKNYDELVLNSTDFWMILFWSPYDQHSKDFRPHWETAAKELLGKVKFAMCDSRVANTELAHRFGYISYPNIKVYHEDFDYGDGKYNPQKTFDMPYIG